MPGNLSKGCMASLITDFNIIKHFVVVTLLSLLRSPKSLRACLLRVGLKESQMGLLEVIRVSRPLEVFLHIMMVSS